MPLLFLLLSPLPASRKVQICWSSEVCLSFCLTNPKVRKQNYMIIDVKFQDESLVLLWLRVCQSESAVSCCRTPVRLFCSFSSNHRSISVPCSRLKRCEWYVRAAESRCCVIPTLAHFYSDSVQQLCAAHGCSCCVRQEEQTGLVSSLMLDLRPLAWSHSHTVVVFSALLCHLEATVVYIY